MAAAGNGSKFAPPSQGCGVQRDRRLVAAPKEACPLPPATQASRQSSTASSPPAILHQAAAGASLPLRSSVVCFSRYMKSRL